MVILLTFYIYIYIYIIYIYIFIYITKRNSQANINISSEGGQCSSYVIELGNYLKWLKREIFNKIRCSESKEW